MNNSINYSGFVEMFLNSGDDFEPYGCVRVPSPSSEGPYERSTPRQPPDVLNDEPALE